MCAAAQQGPSAHFTQGPLADYVMSMHKIMLYAEKNPLLVYFLECKRKRTKCSQNRNQTFSLTKHVCSS